MSTLGRVREWIAARLSAAALLVTLGFVWLGISIWNFRRELTGLETAALPVAAFVLTGGLSAVLIYLGYRLWRSPFDPAQRWSIVGWTVAGLLVTVALQSATLTIRAAEGRTIGEPQFPLLVVGGVGALAGYGIGELLVSARQSAIEAREARDGMAFANSLLRHDVRNGLQVVLGQVDLLATVDDDRVTTASDRIESQVESLYELTENASAVTAVLTDEASPEPRDVSEDVVASVETVCDTFSQATVETELHDGLLVRGTDALRPVFDNLMSNAAQHAGDSPTVRVRTTTNGDDAQIRIEDDGRGVPEGERSRIFERGVTTDGGSNGLGLHIVSTIVERSGGSIRVEDSDLGGAAFVVELPRAE